MNTPLTEDDIQWLAKILAMIPGLPTPTPTIEKLAALQLIEQTPIGWQATEKGIVTIMGWKTPE